MKKPSKKVGLTKSSAKSKSGGIRTSMPKAGGSSKAPFGKVQKAKTTKVKG